MNAVVERAETRKRVSNITPMQMLAVAVERGDDLERIKQLRELYKEWKADEAKSAYIQAFSDFKRNMPDVVKDMLNKQYGSDYSSLANLVNTTNRALGEYGLHAAWDPVVKGNVVSVACILTHVDGHEQRVTIEGPPDTSGQKNPLQQIKSSLTYLEGATFQAITGVVARSASKDDDGNGAGGKPDPEAPEGYEDWKADMIALADEGIDKLKAAWSKSDSGFRRFVVKSDETWWNQAKSKASKVKTP
jgi:ERF superfamily protein